MVYEDLKVDITHQCLDRLHEMRDALEAKHRIRLPIIVHLKGNSLRVGKIENYSVKLKKGSLFRLFQSKKVVGSSKACYCDLGDHFKKLRYDDILKIGYGRYSLRVVGKESMEEAEMEIGEEHCRLASPTKSQSRFGFKINSSKWNQRVKRKMSESIREELQVSGPKSTKVQTEESSKEAYASKFSSTIKTLEQLENRLPPRPSLTEPAPATSVRSKIQRSNSGESGSSNNLDDSVSSRSKASNSASSSR